MKETIEKAVKLILSAVNVNVDDENFKDTPSRVAKAYEEMLDGADGSKIGELFTKAFPSTYGGIVKQKNIKTTSLCPHHLLPIKYEIDIGYVSRKGKMLGLSKLTRLATLLSHRLVLQETLTEDIANTLYEKLEAEGVMVIVRGVHGCMAFRGVNQDVVTITSSIKGLFTGDLGLRQEFINLE